MTETLDQHTQVNNNQTLSQKSHLEEMQFMLFEQSELDINFLSFAVALSNFKYKVGNVCLIE